MNARYVKTMGLMLLASALLFSCNEHASIEVHIDSTAKQKVANIVDSAGSGLRRAGEKIGEGAKELGHKAKETIDDVANDSLKKH